MGHFIQYQKENQKGMGFLTRPHLRADGLFYRKGNSVFLFLILPFKHSHEVLHPKCFIKIKLLIEMRVLGGGNRLCFHINKKANYRNEK